jgi:hypothetical protein
MWNRAGTITSRAAVSILLTVAAISAEAGGRGTDIVAMGGGYINGAEFVSGTPRDITFSFFVGFDRHNALDGAFQYKIVVPGEGNTHGVSTQLTEFAYGADDCPWVQMHGAMKFRAYWQEKPRNEKRVEYFSIKVWDCDSLSMPDSVQIWVWREDPNNPPPEPPEGYPFPRNGQTLDGRTELTGGNIMVR